MTQTEFSKGLLTSVEENQLFDADWYTQANPDVKYSGMSAAEHFLRVGLPLKRAPSEGTSVGDFLSKSGVITKKTDAPKKPAPRPQIAVQPATKSVPDFKVASAQPARIKVDVIVSVFNALDDVKLCLHSLVRCETSFDQRILVVNDGSDEETTRWLHHACNTMGSDHVKFQLIKHKVNIGYTRAVNSGLKVTDAPYVVTLNSDTIVTPFWLDGLVNCMNSSPEIGITGPMSNAASWQNVPDLLNDEKKFAINALKPGMSPDAMADIVRRASQKIYPRTPFVNGFCFMLRREVLDKIGYLDEQAFPKGYGEENDLCIRAQDAGFALAYADDAYVFHAKSKSFGSAQRDKLSKAGTKALKSKHTELRFSSLLKEVKNTDKMDEIRARIREQTDLDAAAAAKGAASQVMRLRVLFLLPVKGGGGGVHSVVQEVTAMRRMGIEAKVAVRDKHLEHYHELYDDIPEVMDLFLGFGPSALTPIASGFDVLVGTIFTSIELVRDVVAACPWILPAYYAQDYEPMFFEKSDNLYTQALQSYDLIPGALVFAKTHWICRTIEESHKVRVKKVSPSIDHEVYHPTPDATSNSIKFTITAMIRPRTPRRGAGRTLELLKRLHQKFGNKIDVQVFGCENDSPEFLELDRGFPFVNKGVISRPQVAETLRQADMFIDLSDYQAFGRTSLEAMACGIIAVVPQAGGGDEYAVDGVNSLVVDSMNVDACFDRISKLLDDPAPIKQMRLNALNTAAQYNPRRAAISELTAIAQARAEYFNADQTPG